MEKITTLEQLIEIVREELDALRAAEVEPMCLTIFGGQLGWYKFRALPGHPDPGNAGRGYSHPVILLPRQPVRELARELVEDRDEDTLRREIADPVLRALELNIGDWDMICAWRGDRSASDIYCIDLCRAGINPWEEYPDAGLPPESEIIREEDGSEHTVQHWGGESERKRVRKVRLAETEHVDNYMRSYLARIGAKGGAASGEIKKRGDSRYYRELAAKRERGKRETE